ncbi:hypothetical protein [Pseudonocardia sp.]|uniref:hypothetical protein n=1 Tax=Pseudonocardia sp. TaxID=60912 RepID=UPI002608BCF3|nr:hypothetical protein [Pseudonocardia sp.]
MTEVPRGEIQQASSSPGAPPGTAPAPADHLACTLAAIRRCAASAEPGGRANSTTSAAGVVVPAPAALQRLGDPAAGGREVRSREQPPAELAGRRAEHGDVTEIDGDELQPRLQAQRR